MTTTQHRILSAIDAGATSASEVAAAVWPGRLDVRAAALRMVSTLDRLERRGWLSDENGVWTVTDEGREAMG